MSPGITVSTGEISQTGGNIGVTGVAFVPVVTDAAPPSAPSYTAVRSIADFAAQYGPRSSTSATAYDWLNELFADGGQLAYVTRVTDNTASAAALTLNDTATHPTVVITASPGTYGNGLYAVVTRGTAATVTMTIASSSMAVTAVSSFANIGVGTYLTGTGLPAGVYVTAVSPSTSSLTLSANATSSSTPTVTPVTYTVLIEDVNGNVFETHGPYSTTAQLYADLSSTLVTFTQSAGGSNTVECPAAVTLTALTGGANANDLTVASSVSALANFPRALGPGTVAIPGFANSTAWTGILAHCALKNRFGVLDLPDNSSSSAVVANFGTISVNGTYGMAIEGSLILPGLVPGTTRTVAGSAGVAALRAQVAAGANQAANPGYQLSLSYPTGFTEYYGVGGAYLGADVNTMEAAGINCWAILQGQLRLYGFVTPVPKTVDQIFWQATASTERMALVYDGENVLLQSLFATLSGNNAELIAAKTRLIAMGANHQAAGALFGPIAVNMDAPINTPATLQAGQLNANLQVQISPYADSLNESITFVPLSVSVS